MPLSGGKYVAPHWVNNSAPALDAAELQAICDTVVKNQTEAGKIPGMQTAINGKAETQVVSYTGTGTYGQDNPVRVNFSFPPRFVCVTGSGRNGRTGCAIFVCGMDHAGDQLWGGGSVDGVRFSGYSVEWWTEDVLSGSAGQFNDTGEKYVVFGIE